MEIKRFNTEEWHKGGGWEFIWPFIFAFLVVFALAIFVNVARDDDTRSYEEPRLEGFSEVG